MKTYQNNVLVVEDLSLSLLASGNKTARKKLLQLLNAEGRSGWYPYHVADSVEGLMVFLTRERVPG